MREVADAGATLVFAHRHVADPVQAILDRPMTSVHCKQIFGIGAISANAGNRIGHFGRALIALDACSLNTQRLGESRPIEMPYQPVAGLKMSELDSTVPFIGRTSFVKLRLSDAFGVGGKGRD